VWITDLIELIFREIAHFLFHLYDFILLILVNNFLLVHLDLNLFENLFLVSVLSIPLPLLREHERPVVVGVGHVLRIGEVFNRKSAVPADRFALGPNLTVVVQSNVLWLIDTFRNFFVLESLADQ
jgi:hypothetical protein